MGQRPDIHFAKQCGNIGRFVAQIERLHGNVFVRGGQLVQRRQLDPARRAPGRPDIEQYERAALFSRFRARLLIALMMFIVYFFMDKKLDAQTGEEEEKDDPFRIRDLGKILSSGVFWLVALLCVLYYSAIFPFQKYVSAN